MKIRSSTFRDGDLVWDVGTGRYAVAVGDADLEHNSWIVLRWEDGKTERIHTLSLRIGNLWLITNEEPPRPWCGNAIIEEELFVLDDDEES